MIAAVQTYINGLELDLVAAKQDANDWKSKYEELEKNAANGGAEAEELRKRLDEANARIASWTETMQGLLD